jgi:hypothetical protein
MYKVLLRDISLDPSFLDHIPPEFDPGFYVVYDEEEVAFHFLNEYEGIQVMINLLEAYIESQKNHYDIHCMDAKKTLEKWKMYDITLRIQRHL